MSAPIDEDPPKRDYPIGYGKPPVGRRFEKGQSGNLKGRPKIDRVRDIGSVLESIGQESVSITQDGKPKQTTKLEAMIRRQIAEALKGDTPAARSILQRALKHGLAKKTMQRSFIAIIEPTGEFGELLRVYHRQNLSAPQLTQPKPPVQ